MTAILVSAVIGGLIGGLYSYVQRRIALARAERMIRDLRAMVGGDQLFRAPGSDEAGLVARLQDDASEEQAMVALGFTVLGDLAFHRTDQPALGIMRVLVDSTKTILGYLVVLPQSPTNPRCVLESYSRSLEFSSMRAERNATLATAPSSCQQQLAANLDHAELVAKHRDLARPGDPDDSLIRVTSLDELIPVLLRFQTLVADWRAAQPPDELLDADLRGLLGVHYARLGERWKKRLAIRLPRARLRVKP